MSVIGLLDLDGVLVRPGGYHKAFQDTLNFFLKQAGLHDDFPGDQISALFESLGVSNEWDMTAICLVIALEELLRNHPKLAPDIHLVDMLKCLNIDRSENLVMDYETIINKISPLLFQDDFAPSKALMESALNKQDGLLFPRMKEHHIFQQLLGDTSAEMNSPTTRIFQNFVLGDQLFEEVYRQSASFKTKSYLKLHDKSLLYDSTLELIQRLVNEQKLALVVYTARNSYPPREIGEHYPGYAPEAEMALDVVGLNGFPLISTGRLNFLAERMNQNIRYFLKPAPFQALAAIAAAIMGHELEALIWAADIYDVIADVGFGAMKSGSKIIPQEMRDLDIHIFEDSSNGLKSGRAAVQILKNLGARVNLHLWGIAENELKIDALRSHGARIVKDPNQALAQAFSYLVR